MENTFEYNGYINIYSPGAGADNPTGPEFIYRLSDGVAFIKAYETQFDIAVKQVNVNLGSSFIQTTVLSKVHLTLRSSAISSAHGVQKTCTPFALPVYFSSDSTV